MRQLRHTLWLTLILTSSPSKAEVYYPAGAALQTGFQLPELTVVHLDALVDVPLDKASRKGASTGEQSCTSLMGPTCFYRASPAPPDAQDSSTAEMQECSSPPLGHPGRERTEGVLQWDVGIMAEYLHASQSQLGAVHGHSGAISEQWQQVGAAREGGLDDVVHVKVGRGGSVQSVYQRSESLRTPDQAESPAIGNCERERTEAAPTGGSVSDTHPRNPEGELQATAQGAHSVCEWSSIKDDDAVADSVSSCPSKNAESEQQRGV